MSANPHANGGLLLRDLQLPNFRDYAIDLPSSGSVTAEATRVRRAAALNAFLIMPLVASRLACAT